MKTAVIFGSTGLIGNYLRHELEKDPSWEIVYIAVRKNIPALHSREKIVVVDFDNLQNYPDIFRVDAVFCCLGTTIKKVGGNQEAFRMVDATYPIGIANQAREHGASSLLVISAMGANSHARIFYNRVKGDMEAGIQAAGIPNTYILRPSLLMGERTEKRFGEKMAQLLMPLLSPLFIGQWKHYRPIHGHKVARALLHLANFPQAGTHILLSYDIEKTGGHTEP
jgi:uncharacterized protein YbjT (DUF2867 family)